VFVLTLIEILGSQHRLTHSPPVHAEKAGNYIVIWHEFKLMNLKRSRRNILTLLCQTVSDRSPGCLINSHLPQQLLSNEMRDLVRDFSLFPNIIIVIQELLRLLFWLQHYSAVFSVSSSFLFLSLCPWRKDRSAMRSCCYCWKDWCRHDNDCVEWTTVSLQWANYKNFIVKFWLLCHSSCELLIFPFFRVKWKLMTMI